MTIGCDIIREHYNITNKGITFCTCICVEEDMLEEGNINIGYLTYELESNICIGYLTYELESNICIGYYRHVNCEMHLFW